MWKITEDFLEVKGSPRRHVTVKSQNWDEKLRDKVVQTFILFDDDRRPYFRGSATIISFAPLDQFGEAYGCAYIKYLNASGKYEIL